MSGRNIKFMCTEVIWKMLDEMNPRLEKLAEEPYETIRVYEVIDKNVETRGF